MILVTTAPDAILDAAVVGLALAPRLGTSKRLSLLIDADPRGSKLVGLLTDKFETPIDIGRYGLPHIAGHDEPLTVAATRQHALRFPGIANTRILLGSPAAGGASVIADYLGDRPSELATLNSHWTVVVSAGEISEQSPLLPLLHAAHAIIYITPVKDVAAVAELGDVRYRLGSNRNSGQRFLLIVEGDSPHTESQISEAARMRSVGRLPRRRTGRRHHPHRSQRSQLACLRENSQREYRLRTRGRTAGTPGTPNPTLQEGTATTQPCRRHPATATSGHAGTPPGDFRPHRRLRRPQLGAARHGTRRNRRQRHNTKHGQLRRCATVCRSAAHACAAFPQPGPARLDDTGTRPGATRL